MNEMEQEKRVSLHADVMLRRALDLRAKNNVLIAEFMGMKLGQDHTNENMYYDDAENLHPPTPIDELKFHTSWDWLMPVVEKCYDNGADENEVGDITHALLDCDIDHTYKAVVEFINQLNK